MQTAPTIGDAVAAHVLWQMGHGGYQPGTFVEQLLKTFAAADEHNLATLEAVFPEYGAAWAAATYDPDGIARLQQIAGGAA